MKKLISSLLAVMMLFSIFSVSAAFAEAPDQPGKSDIVTEFLKETDFEKQDIVLQSQSKQEDSDLIIRQEGETIHLVSLTNNKEDSHIQLNPTGIYLGAGDTVTLLRYATVTAVMEDIFKEVDAMLEQSIQSIPEDQKPTEAEIQNAVNQLALLTYAAAVQEEKDAATLSAAAAEFASKFKPEYILDVKEVWGGVEVSLRSEAYASAMAEAMDGLMTNPALAELVDRKAALQGGKTFAELQQEWLINRKATLEAIRTAESVETLGTNGHFKSHFQIGEETSAIKILVCDTDAWINADGSKVQGVVSLGFKNEDPFLVYELNANPYYYWEKISSGDSSTELYYDIDKSQPSGISYGKTVTVIEGQEWMRAEVGPSYLYMRGPKGSIGTTVRETWTGKTRYELVIETAKGEEATITCDFYEDYDSLVCDLYTDVSDDYATYKISRIDKVDIEDLSTSEKITEITEDQINAMLDELMKLAMPKVVVITASK